MKRILVILLLLISLLPLFSKEYLYDNADLLSQSEKEVLSSILESVSENTGLNTVIVTYSSPTYSSMDVADAIIEKAEYESNGVCFAINMAERDYYISTMGDAVYYLDDNALSDRNLSSVLFPYLSDGAYYTAFSRWAEYVEYSCDYEDNASDTEDGGFEWGISLFFSLSLGAFISLMIVMRGKKKLKNIAPQNSADDYIVPDSFVLTRNKDIYLYSNVVRVRRPNNDGPRPGGPHHSTMHTSSSGMSHGGRGGRF